MNREDWGGSVLGAGQITELKGSLISFDSGILTWGVAPPRGHLAMTRGIFGI